MLQILATVAAAEGLEPAKVMATTSTLQRRPRPLAESDIEGRRSAWIIGSQVIEREDAWESARPAHIRPLKEQLIAIPQQRQQ